MASCTDQEWRTYRFASSRTCSPSWGLVSIVATLPPSSPCWIVVPQGPDPGTRLMKRGPSSGPLGSCLFGGGPSAGACPRRCGRSHRGDIGPVPVRPSGDGDVHALHG